ncbi:MAG: hypothetical protein HY974_01785 [Candidatus Kerfeldbacteria bacterium]|nr:hypothetical protein [Candidatus Kerfeldbacteria bacterium]
MRNYASKSLKRVTRFRTPSSFKVRASEGAKRAKLTPPYHPPGRGRRTAIGR